jgi:acyl carrier protein
VRPVDEIVGRLQQLFLQHLHIEVLEPHTDLVDTGLRDSLQLVDLLGRIEETFGVRLAIDTIDLGDLRSLSGLAKLVNTSRKGVPALRKASV